MDEVVEYKYVSVIERFDGEKRKKKFDYKPNFH